MGRWFSDKTRKRMETWISYSSWMAVGCFILGTLGFLDAEDWGMALLSFLLAVVVAWRQWQR